MSNFVSMQEYNCVLKGTVPAYKFFNRFTLQGMKEVFYYTAMRKAFPEVIWTTLHSEKPLK